MNTPKFAVGEVVVLQSVDSPELNGDHTVIMIPYAGEEYDDPITGVRCIQNDSAPFAYILDDPDMVIRHMGAWLTTTWHESALRKKHQPGTESFQDMMRSLKSPTNGTQSQSARW